MQIDVRQRERERELEAALAEKSDSAESWREYIALAVDDARLAIATQRFRRSVQHVRPTAEMHLLAARAFAGQNLWLGKSEARTIDDGRVGQFAGDWLAIEKLDGLDRFRCVPADSALFHVRRSLDAGYDGLDAYVLHARAWLMAGKPATAWQIIESHQSRLFESGDERLLREVLELAIASDRISAALRYAQLCAARQPAQRDQILFDAYVRCADRSGLAGDDALYRDLLTRAAELRPKDATIALRVADAEYESGNRPRAREWYRRTIDLAPQHSERLRILTRLSE
ncbi:MAG: hypothetical protein ACKVS9_05865 [Phycisphaerae bacterium]